MITFNTVRKGSRPGRRQVKRHVRQSQPIHKRFILHPATVMVILIMGVLIVGWTLHIAAQSYSVTAKVPADPLTEGAIITDPQDGATATTSTITVSGTCPDGSYVKLFRNGTFSGVAGCSASNGFAIDTSLVAGANNLQAQDYNITDDPGPVTQGITITCLVPTPTVSSSAPTPAVSTTQAPSPPTLTSDYHYQAFATSSLVTWSVQISGGTAPYSLRAVWGDGVSSTQSVATESTVTITHTYSKPGYYAIKLYLTDSKKALALIQLVAFVKFPSTSGLIASSGGTGAAGSHSFWDELTKVSNAWLWLAWPTYLTVLLMAVSFWLGERQMIQYALEHQASHLSTRKKNITRKR